jgi:hypothetical protein
LAQKSITAAENPLYFPDFTPNYFWLFPKIKSTFKGQKVQDTDNIQKT